MSKEMDEMAPTSMRVARRTASLVGFIAKALEVATNEPYTADEVVWNALSAKYPDYVEMARQAAKREEDKQERE